MNTLGFSSLPPLSLYIHIPWCVRKCPYCDFNSHTSDDIPETSYINALIDDLKQDAHWAQGRTLQSIFIGGGTPSLFSETSYQVLLKSIAELMPIAADAEITLEANPGTFEQEKFFGYRQTGINRLSVGVQSFQSRALSVLGRIHSADEAITAIESAQQAGFDNLNIDLMFGLPEQTSEQALADLKQAIALQPTHISWYQLTIEPNTLFYNQPPPLPEDENITLMQETGQSFLSKHGYLQYEVSAYARDQYASHHNLNYWQFGDYLAIGAGAHGKITCLNQQRVIRYHKTRLPKDYLNPDKSFTARTVFIDADDLIFEFFLNGLRLLKGIEKASFTPRTGIAPDTISPLIGQAKQKGLLSESLTHWTPTPLGQRYLNDLQALFLP